MFGDIFSNKLAKATGVSVATGYIGKETYGEYRNRIVEIAAEGGPARILVGMAFYQGLSASSHAGLLEMNAVLREIDGTNGIFVTYAQPYHGKIYILHCEDGMSRAFVGSSNFSKSGLSGNLEAMLEATDEEAKARILSYSDFLFSPAISSNLELVSLPILGSQSYKRSIDPLGLASLQRVAPPKPTTMAFEVNLKELVKHTRSNLNVYFGKGRLNRISGVVTPRKWFEVEIIVRSVLSSSPGFPRGPFIAITDDGYRMPMVTNGDYFKNLRSHGNLSLLGEWIKGKLQRSGALVPLTLISEETLDLYGNDTIRFFRTNGPEYLMAF